MTTASPRLRGALWTLWVVAALLALDVVGGVFYLLAVLVSLGARAPVECIQGIDPAVFHPAPRRGDFPDRFVIFSGGKLELNQSLLAGETGPCAGRACEPNTTRARSSRWMASDTARRKACDRNQASLCGGWATWDSG